MNTEGFPESWNFSCISVRSSLPISANMWNISTWSAKYLISHHFKWRNWPGTGQNSTTIGGRGALGSAFSFLSLGRSVSLDASSSSGLGCSAGSLTSIGRNVSLSRGKIAELTQVWSGHSLYHRPHKSLQSSVCPNIHAKHASGHPWTLLALEAPREVYLSTGVFRSACSSSVHLRSMRCAFSFGIRTSEFPLASFDSNHCSIVKGFAICFIQHIASGWASSSSVRIAFINLFTVEYNASAPCFSITVSSSGSSGAPENGHILW